MSSTAHARYLTFVVFTLLLVSTSACSPHVYSPPARVAPVETARTLDADTSSVQVAGGFFSELFGVEGELVSARVRHGLTDALELGGEATLIHINAEGSAETHPNIYEGRAGLKWAPAWAQDYLAVTAGLGGGASAAGGFITPDVGINLAFENSYIVPFVTGSMLVSVPMGAKAVDLSETDEDPGSDVQTPVTTWGATIGGGLSVPVRFGPAEDSHKGAVAFSISWTYLWDEVESSGIPTIAPAVELVF